MNIEQVKSALILAAHPDDGELGCGATMARLSDVGVPVTVLMISDRGEPTWLSEAIAAATAIGETVLVETLHHTCFHFELERQAIVRAFEHYRDKFGPEIVFAPADGDKHQDHATCLYEARRVFRDVTLLGYQIARSNRKFRPEIFVPVEARHVTRKADAVFCYATQRGKRYCFRETIEGQARHYGAMCDREFAEAFSVEWAVL